MLRRKKKFAVVGGALALVLCSSLAFALWTAHGSGSGTAKARTAQTITVAGATGTADLYPGFTGGNVYFTMTNTNPYPVTFTSMTPGSIVSGDPTNCPASNVSVTSATGLSLSVPANSTSATSSVNGVVSMASTAPDGCQGVSFTINLTLDGSQS
jgi:hypothetical protein